MLHAVIALIAQCAPIDRVTAASSEQAGAEFGGGRLLPNFAFPIDKAVAIDGNTAVVGAWKQDISPWVDSGSAFVFRRQGGAWVLEQEITIPNLPLESRGASVSISGNLIAIGAPMRSLPSGPRDGGVHTYERVGGVWTYTSTRECPAAVGDSSSFLGNPEALFGMSMFMSGTTVVVGAPQGDSASDSESGNVLVFQYTTSPGTGLTLVSTLGNITPSTEMSTQLKFGASVSISKDQSVIAVGAPHFSSAPNGKVFVYRKNAGVWGYEQVITPGVVPAGNVYYGSSVSVEGEWLVVGASLWDLTVGLTTYTNSGACFVYKYNSVTQLWDLFAPPFANSDVSNTAAFGQSVAISVGVKPMFLVGAWGQDSALGTDVGAAYLYSIEGSAIIEKSKILPTQASALDLIGGSVAISDVFAIVGSPGAQGDTILSDYVGAAYLFNACRCVGGRCIIQHQQL